MRGKSGQHLRRQRDGDRRGRNILPGDTNYSFVISQRYLDGLYLIRYLLCDRTTYGRTLRPLFDRIGGGAFTILPEPDPLIVNAVHPEAIEENRVKARNMLGIEGEIGSFLGTDTPDLDRVGCTGLIYSQLAHEGMKLLAKKFKHQHRELGITSTAKLYVAIGMGAVTIIPRLDEELRYRYLSQLPEVREYLEMDAAIADRERRSIAAL